MQNNDPGIVLERPPLREPEDVHDIYRVFAAPLKVNWIPVHEQTRKRVIDEGGSSMQSEEGGSSGRQRGHRQRQLSTGIDDLLEPVEGNQSQRDNEVSLEDRVLPPALSEDIDVGQGLSQGQRNASQSSGPSARAFATRNRNKGGVGGSGMVVEGGLGSTPIRSGY